MFIFLNFISASNPHYFRACVCVCVVEEVGGIKMLIKGFVVFGPLTLGKMSAAHWCETTLNAAA